MDPMGLWEKRRFPFNQLLLSSHVTGCKLRFSIQLCVIVIQNVGGDKSVWTLILLQWMKRNGTFDSCSGSRRLGD